MKPKRAIYFGAHPDDCDEFFGGTALSMIRNGHQVKFVSMTNGDAGHHRMTRPDLAERRYRETRRVLSLSGIVDYQILPIHDTELEVTLANRRKVIEIIRDFSPDLVVTHRPCDYHADHRATAQLIQDAAYLVMVPLCCPESAIRMEQEPIFAYSADLFTTPRPFRVDASVNIDPVAETKLDLLLAHESQFLEWLPWIMGDRSFDPAKVDPREYVREHFMAYDRRCAAMTGSECRYAEAFELSEYGRRISPEDFQHFLNS